MERTDPIDPTTPTDPTTTIDTTTTPHHHRKYRHVSGPDTINS